MYQASSVSNNPLEEWKQKKYELLLGITPSPPPRSYSDFSYRTESSFAPTPLPRTPLESDYKIKLTTSRKVGQPEQKFEIPITRSLYLKLKNRSAISPITGDLQPSEEIDYLTTLLMDSLANCDDPHIIGMCYACGTKVSGEENGCLAFGRLYHVNCFVCCRCQNTLRGSPFYVVNNQPYCHKDYLNTLEKCRGCSLPITDKIINTDTETFHASCFQCVECKTNLDGVPFALDKFGQHHCVPCFHQKYAPRCDRCHLAIAPVGNDKETVRVQAIGKNLHISCYKCEDCLLPLSRPSGELDGCFPHSGAILCENCYTTRINQEAKANIRSVLK